MNDYYVCPACGYPGLIEPPRDTDSGGSYEICLSCGFQFGVSDDDLGYTYESWRAEWIARGMPWDSTGIQAVPAGWDPARQLADFLDTGNGRTDA
ncbi:hypothetical protein SAMN05443575_3761 [Jatrophihabitans endophyticus]|uniref:Uncharacterized protein n=1 Tax=Jatrophihabitans endophyticus TaxID=1206085 RepID=A0A1M5S7R6_9ACTN|nr:hypothetical protein [Jatrophihabitans endophyticus]SHH34490.1 hypothetical protein SAMN05443575_3761 [Jatrophihabitans endophyticus]